MIILNFLQISISDKVLKNRSVSMQCLGHICSFSTTLSSTQVHTHWTTGYFLSTQVPLRPYHNLFSFTLSFFQSLLHHLLNETCSDHAIKIANPLLILCYIICFHSTQQKSLNYLIYCLLTISPCQKVSSMEVGIYLFCSWLYSKFLEQCVARSRHSQTFIR